MSPATVVCALIILCSASGNTELLSHFRHATIRALAESSDLPALATVRALKWMVCLVFPLAGPEKLPSPLH